MTFNLLKMGVNSKIRRVTISLKPSLLEIIDEQRGLIPRSTFIDNLIRKQLQPILEEREGSPSRDGDLS